MPESWLSGLEEHTDLAVRILSEALLARYNKKVTITHTDTANDATQQLDARYTTFQKVTLASSGKYITLSPRQSLDITIRAVPLLHNNVTTGEPEVHTAHVDRHGDFLFITSPYYFYDDHHEVSYKKWCMFLNLPRATGRK